MALDILHDNWGPYTHTEVENALKAYLATLEQRINEAIQSGGVGMADLSAEVQALLNKANTALQPENIAAWAKAQNKPGYTVSEITGVEGFQNLLAKLQDMDQKIQAAAASGGVDPDDEMSSTSEKPVQNKVIKAYVDGLIQGLQNVLNTITQDGATQGVIDTFNEVKAFLEGISSSDTLAAKLATLVPQTRTINGKALSSNVTIGMSDIQGLVDAINNAGSGAVSVLQPDPADGTFTIRVGSTDYTINLNHEHPQYQPLLTAGANITIVQDQQTGNWVISASGGGSGFSGDYNDLTNKPTIPVVPTNVSSFTNDAGYLTSQDISGKADKIVVVEVSTAGAVSQALDANKFYKFTGALTSLTLTLNAVSGSLAVYAGKFTTGSGWSSNGLSVPAGVTEAANNDEIEASKSYEFSIVDNVLVIKEV